MRRTRAARASREEASEEKQEVLVGLATSTQHPQPSGVRWNGDTRLSGREEAFAGGAGGAPTYDTAVGLRFMQSVQGRLDAHGGRNLESGDHRSARDLPVLGTA